MLVLKLLGLVLLLIVMLGSGFIVAAFIIEARRHP